VASSSLRNLPPEGVTDEAATLRAELTTSGEATTVKAYCGTRDGKHRPDDWEFAILVGDHKSGVIEVPLEELKPGTKYYYTFQARTGVEVQSWAPESMTFTTKPTAAMQNNRQWIRGPGRREIPARGFISSKPASRWGDALLSGNGKIGALVMGRPLDEKIILAHERVRLPLHKPLLPIDQASLLPEIRRLIREGKYQDAVDLVFAESWKEGYGLDRRTDPFRAALPIGRMVIRWTDPFVPAMDLLVHTEGKGDLRNSVRTVDFSTGVATVRWEDERGAFRRRLFVSRPDNVVVLSIEGPSKGKLSCVLELARRPIDKETTYFQGQEKAAYGIKQTEIGADRQWLTYRSSFARSEGGYQGAAHVIVKSGWSGAEGHKLVIRDADEVLVLLRLEPLENYANSDIGTLKNDLMKVEGDFPTLLARHAKIHGEIFNRVKLDLNEGEDRYLPTEDLIAKSTVENTSIALLEKVFDAGRYTILSSSGDWPPALQGKWTGTWGPPWSGDYTLDGNVQSAIASMLDGNMPESMESVFNYLESLLPALRENAKRLFGCRGIVLPTRASTHGFNNHFDETWPMTFWTAGAGWMARFYYDYYLYTGDRDFLLRRALPFMKEVALFYEDFLTEEENGKYVFNPSYSPENNPTNGPSQAAINATMDIAVAKDLLSNLVEACTTLNVEPEGVARWKRMLTKMPEYMLNADGAVKEWAWPTLEDNYQHRHCSHLYPLWYGLAPDVADNPQLLQGFRRAIELRMQERVRQGGGTMAFGMIQLGQAATSLGDGQTAYTFVRWLANRNYYTGLASSHDSGPRIFNVDISGGLPDVMIRMLVQSKPGRIDLLPALPEQLASGKIDGVLARGQILVKSLKWNPEQVRVVLNSGKDQTLTLSVPRDIASIQAAAGQTEIKETGFANRRQLALPARQDVELLIEMK
jgi:hypothetical protein